MSLNCLHNSPHYKLTMEFRLPTNLQSELLAYDPALKALAKSKAPAKPKTKYPLGNPPLLFPLDVVDAAEQQRITDEINTKYARDRYYILRDAANEYKVKAIVYHYEQSWYAAWFPPAGKETDYLYGYSFAFKDTAAARKMIPSWLRDNLEKVTTINQNKSMYYTHAQCITKEDIVTGETTKLMPKFINHWNIPNVANYSDKGSHIYANTIKRFKDQLEGSIPVWKDALDMFYRLSQPTYVDILLNKQHVVPSYYEEINNNKWLPSVDNFFKLAKANASMHYRNINEVKHIINTPFFRKWIQEQCDICIKMYNDESNEALYIIKQPFNKILVLAEAIKYVNSIWPDCPVDYYQANLSALLATSASLTLRNPQTAVRNWLNTNMPVASFFNILNKNYEENIDTTIKRTNINHKSGLPVVNFYSYNDTINMLETLLEANVKLIAPKRWRITEFHDYVQSETWKIRNPNQVLPQDLFITPIKVEAEESRWSFFQPIDTHQLSAWGQAVRNCVGNATSYADGVRKKKHFIVLAMLDGKPTFTIQLKVNHGLMSVEQIVSTNNARLTDEQRQQYTKAFSLALQEREKQLASA